MLTIIRRRGWGILIFVKHSTESALLDALLVAAEMQDCTRGRVRIIKDLKLGRIPPRAGCV